MQSQYTASAGVCQSKKGGIAGEAVDYVVLTFPRGGGCEAKVRGLLGRGRSVSLGLWGQYERREVFESGAIVAHSGPWARGRGVVVLGGCALRAIFGNQTEQVLDWVGECVRYGGELTRLDVAWARVGVSAGAVADAVRRGAYATRYRYASVVEGFDRGKRTGVSVYFGKRTKGAESMLRVYGSAAGDARVEWETRGGLARRVWSAMRRGESMRGQVARRVRVTVGGSGERRRAATDAGWARAFGEPGGVLGEEDVIDVVEDQVGDVAAACDVVPATAREALAAIGAGLRSLAVAVVVGAWGRGG